MKNFRIVTVVTLIVATVAALASLLLPVPKGETTTSFYVNVVPSVATSLLYIGGSAVLLMGFGAFTDKLRRPYIIISTGLVIWGLSYLLLPILVITGQINNDAVLSAAALAVTGTAIMTFVGTRKLARLFNVKSLVQHWWFIVATIIGVAILLVVMPHAPYDDEFEGDLANVILMLPNIFFAFSGYLVLLIKRQASVTFTNALAWLCLSMFVTVVAFVSSTTAFFLFGSAGVHIVNTAAIIPTCLAAALFLRSSYSFNKITESGDTAGLTIARNFFGKPVHPRQKAAPTSVDIVVYTAALVSSPRDIDPLLDNVRLVTSRTSDGQPPAEQDERLLMDTYLKIEDYLLTKESLRVFTKDGLRQDVAQKLGLTADSGGTFWPKLGSI